MSFAYIFNGNSARFSSRFYYLVALSIVAQRTKVFCAKGSSDESSDDTCDIRYRIYFLRRKSEHALRFTFMQLVSQLYTSLTDNLMTNLIVTTLLIFDSANLRDRCAISYQKKIFRQNLSSTDAFSTTFDLSE